MNFKDVVSKECPRIDKFLIDKLNDKFSRTQIKNFIDQGLMKINNKVVTHSSYTPKVGDVVEIILPQWEEQGDKLSKFDLKLQIAYEDDHIIVVDKPNNLVVHPGAGNKEKTLVNALLNHMDMEDEDRLHRAGLVHRIDKQTTGLILIAKSKEVLDFLINEMKQRKIKRKYIAVVHGIIKENTGKIDAPIGRSRVDRKKMMVTNINSKYAVTRFKVIKRLPKHTLIECELETGRTHQIRVHMAFIKHPIVGDHVYGVRSEISDFGQYLHAHELSFFHPKKSKTITIKSEPPKEFKKYT